MSKHEDINGVIWEVLIVGSTWAAQVSADSTKTYTNPGASIDAEQTFGAMKARVEWAQEREPALFGKLPASQPAETINAFARRAVGDPARPTLSIKVTASPDKKDSGAILLLLLLAFILFGGKKKR